MPGIIELQIRIHIRRLTNVLKQLKVANAHLTLLSHVPLGMLFNEGENRIECFLAPEVVLMVSAAHANETDVDACLLHCQRQLLRLFIGHEAITISM